MTRKFKSKYFLFRCFLVFSLVPILKLNAYAEESLKIDLTQELKKGNFLIGLKQYLGSNSASFSEKQNLKFETATNYLELYSSNGLKHKSKKIKIIFQKIPLKSPITIEKFVFGPFASYESAQRQAKKLEDKGYRVRVAYPKNWEVWVPVTEELPARILNYKLVRNSYKAITIPFLVSEHRKQKLQGPIYIS